jgi:hypothetical protein
MEIRQCYLHSKPKQPPFVPSYHRPVVFSKLLLTAAAHRLNYFIHQNHILPPKQFCFRKQHSKVCQFPTITDFITHGFNLRKHTDMVLLVSETSYDTERLNCLLYKLISLLLPDYILFLFTSYLEGHTFTVHLNDFFSKPTPSGLPQDAVLSTIYPLTL